MFMLRYLLKSYGCNLDDYDDLTIKMSIPRFKVVVKTYDEYLNKLAQEMSKIVSQTGFSTTNLPKESE